MKCTKQINGRECTISLNGELTVKNVSEVFRYFTAILGNENIKTLTADLSGTVEADTAGIQLLMALKIYASSLNAEFRLINHSLSVLKIIDLYGLTVFFKDKMIISRKHRDQLSFRYGIKTL